MHPYDDYEPEDEYEPMHPHEFELIRRRKREREEYLSDPANEEDIKRERIRDWLGREEEIEKKKRQREREILESPRPHPGEIPSRKVNEEVQSIENKIKNIKKDVSGKKTSNFVQLAEKYNLLYLKELEIEEEDKNDLHSVLKTIDAGTVPEKDHLNTIKNNRLYWPVQAVNLENLIESGDANKEDFLWASICSHWRALNKYYKIKIYYNSWEKVSDKKQYVIRNYKDKYSKRGYNKIKNYDVNLIVKPKAKANIYISKSAALLDILEFNNSVDDTKKKVDKIEHWLNKATKIEEQDFRLHRALGRFYNYKNQKIRANKHFSRANYLFKRDNKKTNSN